MDWLDTLLTFGGSILSGGATGLLGVLVQRWADHKKQQMDLEVLREQNRHALALREVDIRLTDREWAGRVAVAREEGEARVQAADAAAFGATLTAEPVRWAEGAGPDGRLGRAGWFLMILLDVFRGVVRPGLTVFLCWITTRIYYQTQQLLETYGASLTAADLVGIIRLVIATILYLTTTCVLWWFGTRNRQKPPLVPA